MSTWTKKVMFAGLPRFLEQLLAACFLNVAVDLYQAVLNDLACLRAVLYEVGELEELAEADHVVANKNFFHAS